MTWKLFFLICAVTIAGCEEPESVRGKVYISDPRQGGIARSQAGELIPYSKTEGYYCIKPSDLELFLAQWEAAQQADKE